MTISVIDHNLLYETSVNEFLQIKELKLYCYNKWLWIYNCI